MLAVVTEIESNDTFQSAQSVAIATGDVNLMTADDWLNIDGSIATATDGDFYKFNITAPSGVFFDINAFDIGAPGNLNSAIALFNSTGGIISNGVNDNGYSFFNYAPPSLVGSISSPSFDSSLYLDLQPGTYALRVTGTLNTSGNYRLRMLADSNYSSTVPALNSLPGATDTLYLDFDGYAGANDGWSATGCAVYRRAVRLRR